MTEIMKKNWFVVVVAIIFCGIAIFFTYDQNKDKLPGKTVNGQDVVFTIDGQNFTADDLYNEYYPVGGPDAAYLLAQHLLLDQIVPKTNDLKDEAATMAEQYYQYFYQYYGTQTDAFIETNMKAIGLESLEEYCMYNLMLEQMYSEYIKENLDTLYEPFNEEYRPRFVSHVLIKMDDAEKPTAEEKDRLQKAQEAWNSGEYDFATFAEQFSDDTASAINKGIVGYCDKDSNYVPEFKAAALALNEGEVSEWVKSDYGYHLIMVTSTKMDEVVEEPEFLEHILDANENLGNEVLWARFVEKNISFADAKLEAKIKDALNIKEGSNE